MLIYSRRYLTAAELHLTTNFYYLLLAFFFYFILEGTNDAANLRDVIFVFCVCLSVSLIMASEISSISLPRNINKK